MNDNTRAALGNTEADEKLKSAGGALGDELSNLAGKIFGTSDASEIFQKIITGLTWTVVGITEVVKLFIKYGLEPMVWFFKKAVIEPISNAIHWLIVFKDAFNGARDSIAGAFSAIGDMIWTGVKYGVNKAIGAINSVSGALNKVPGIDIPSIPQLAKGTSSFGGGTALVGEQGPELINLPRGAQVLNAQDTADATGGINIGEVHLHDEMDFDNFVQTLFLRKNWLGL